MKRVIQKAVSAAVVIMMVFTLVIPANAAAAENPNRLHFRDNGEFTIMQVSDMQDGPNQAVITMTYIKALVQEKKPDLIVLTGDNINAGTGKNEPTYGLSRKYVAKAIDSFMSEFEKLGVPVAVVFGNHDGEGRISREEQMRMYMQYDCCVAVDEGSDIYGCGTYNLPVLSSDGKRIAYNIWCFDSNMYDEVNGGYDYVHQDQLDWYVQKSNELKKYNYGNPVPSMVFQHIIVNEIFDALEEGDPVSGAVNETPCPGTVNGGQFETMRQQGDVVAMFFGHDHTNTFVVPYKGIDLSTSPTSGFGSYGDQNRGVRLITVHEDSTAYETEVVNYYDTFCTDEMSTARYIMNSDSYSTSENIRAAFRYIFLNIKQGTFNCSVLREVYIAFT